MLVDIVYFSATILFFGLCVLFAKACGRF